MGHREGHLNRAIELLSNAWGDPLQSSSVLQTEPWGFESKNGFLNQVVIFRCNWHIEKILKLTQDTEKLLGRLQKSKIYYADRIIDLDLLYYGDKQIDTTMIKIPHPKISQRKFVLDSLMELDENWLDVRLGKTIGQLYQEAL